jgi:hypothetical protein
MQPTIFQRWRIPLQESLHRLGCSITNRVPWPQSNFLVSSPRKFVYCPIAKVACTSLKLWMLEIAQEMPPRPFNEQIEAQRYALRKLGLRAANRILNDPEFFSFAFVRNPWSRVVSAYLNKFQSVNVTSARVIAKLRPDRKRADLTADVPFREFIEFLARGNPRKFDEHWRPQHLFLRDMRLDFLGRFEHLSRDFGWVRERLEIDTPLPHHNPTPYGGQAEGQDCVADLTAAKLKRHGPFPDYRRFYTPRLRDLVGQIYAEDIKRFGYEFDS